MPDEEEEEGTELFLCEQDEGAEEIFGMVKGLADRAINDMALLKEASLCLVRAAFITSRPNSSFELKEADTREAFNSSEKKD